MNNAGDPQKNFFMSECESRTPGTSQTELFVTLADG